MTDLHRSGDRSELDPGQVGPDDTMAFVGLALRARGEHVGAGALSRVRRMLDGSLTREQARREIAVEYGVELPEA